MSLANEIDALTDQMYKNHRFAGELGSLAKLFSDSYWNKIGDALRNYYQAPQKTNPQTRSSSNRSIDVGIGWIDKGPYADFNPTQSPITERVEIGDAAVILVSKNTHRGGSHVNARCLVLQAKVGSKYPPYVPIATSGKDPNDSTKKELKLLEDWPTFDLYKASNSGKPLVSGITLTSSSAKVKPYGWFIGADREWQSQIRNFWMAGPATDKAACDVSFGSLMESFLNHQSIRHSGFSTNIDVGFKFNYDSQRVIDLRNGLPSKTNDWDELCHQMLAIIPDRSIPKNASGAVASPGRMGIRINSFPALDTLWTLLPPIRNSWFNLKLGRRPVVLIYMNGNEG